MLKVAHTKKEDKTALLISDSLDEENSYTIQTKWPVGDLKLDSTGTKLVVASHDFRYMFVYSLISHKKRCEPVQQFLISTEKTSSFMPIQIVDYSFKNLKQAMN